MTDFQFHRERKKSIKEKIEDVHLWIKGISHVDKSAWAFGYMDSKKDIIFVFGESKIVDNDRLQLIPIIEFLELISGDDQKRLVTVYSDSNYLVNVLKEWVDKWKKTQFKFPDGGDRPNADLLRKVEALKNNTILNMKNLFTKNDFTEKLENLCRNELNLP